MPGREDVLISATELAELLDAEAPVTILDVRWRLDQPDGSDDHLNGHIPGAVYVALEDDLSDALLDGRGRHPLPRGTDLQDAARRWGVSEGVPVVVYDDWNRVGSGRAWWVLTAAGLTDVRILDGGLGAWRAAGGRMETGPVQPQPGDVTLSQDDLYSGSRLTITAQQAADGVVTLLDARPPERYRGENEPADAVAGHIPGAKNLPFAAVLADDGTFLDDDTLTALLADRDINRHGQVGVYCGSGVSATVPIAAMAVLGRHAALFPGSWSQWSSEPDRPVTRGDE
ncbi:sulfurtransferase [Mycolicibacillus trivialis]|uniref:Thiosulfate sulfurtransferase n=1 Tax=Mycolicibacillus trivialis TaxID=1798 RepID=A0A1X2EJE3_9MYCO|nr:sulfurtransferase [Mycolicibacillus trivialis]ORX03971.1 thiosulfate sulfurtransferase [Mycolicibacillus trivialis]